MRRAALMIYPLLHLLTTRIPRKAFRTWGRSRDIVTGLVIYHYMYFKSKALAIGQDQVGAIAPAFFKFYTYITLVNHNNFQSGL